MRLPPQVSSHRSTRHGHGTALPSRGRSAVAGMPCPRERRPDAARPGAKPDKHASDGGRACKDETRVAGAATKAQYFEDNHAEFVHERCTTHIRAEAGPWLWADEVCAVRRPALETRLQAPERGEKSPPHHDDADDRGDGTQGVPSQPSSSPARTAGSCPGWYPARAGSYARIRMEPGFAAEQRKKNR
jgi:hypothetical protein